MFMCGECVLCVVQHTHIFKEENMLFIPINRQCCMRLAHYDAVRMCVHVAGMRTICVVSE